MPPAPTTGGRFMSRITVYLLTPFDRTNYRAEWVEPGTLKRKSKSPTTPDPDLAEKLSADLEYEVNSGLLDKKPAPPAPPPPIKRPVAGSVYLARAGEWTKIGWAVDVGRRLPNVQVGTPHELTLLRAIRTDDGAW